MSYPTILHLLCYMIVMLRSSIYTYTNTYTSAYAYICGVLIDASSYYSLSHNSGSGILISCKMVDKAFPYYDPQLYSRRPDLTSLSSANVEVVDQMILHPMLQRW